MNWRNKIASVICSKCEEQTHRLGCCTNVLLKDTCPVLDKIIDLFRSEPITVECEECKGKGYKKSYLVKTEIGNFFLYACPSCIDGQRVLMKVRRCTGDISIGQQVKICKKYRESNDGCKLGEAINGKRSCTGKITLPLTLADIDWGEEFKLKEGWEVEI